MKPAQRTITPLLLTALVFASCSWNSGDKMLFAGYGIFSAIDASQTARIKETPFAEANPLFAQNDGTPDMTRVLFFKTLGAGIILMLLDMSKDERTEMLVLANGLQGGVVFWNEYWLRSSRYIPPMKANPGVMRGYYCPAWSSLPPGEEALALCERALFNAQTGKRPKWGK